MEKRLLYYERYVETKFKLNDITRIRVAHLVCKDVKTGEIVTLGHTLYPEVVSKSLAIAESYYDDINKIEHDFDILWNLTDEELSPILYSFEDIQKEYQRLANDGIKTNEINHIIIELFKSKKKIK